MGVHWTEEQQKVIDLGNRNILVSAAAGSGKTAVLVERIIQKLIREENPEEVDRLLIVTFTNAAAAEMKDRIRDAIEKKLEEYPENEHLKRQATLIHNASITTIHSFCQTVIREHFHTIDLDPGFRIAEEGELKLLKHDVLKEMLENRYQEGQPEFLDFSEAYAGGKTDKKLEEVILKIYEFSRSYPDPKEWLEGCVENYSPDTIEEMEGGRYVELLLDTCRKYAKGLTILLDQAMDIISMPDGPYMYEENIMADQEVLESLLECRDFEDWQSTISNIKWKRLKSNKDESVSVDKSEKVKAIRDEVKKLVKKMKEQYFDEDLDERLVEMRMCRPMIRVLTDLTLEFSQNFENEKRSRNMIDFDDMQQYALRILTKKEDGKFVPSPVAKEYQEQFHEIMIDEYQDSNLIQESILTSVSGIWNGNNNIFMVGDVKQSIYRFRLSRPELFMEKFDTYSLTDSDKQRIDLHKNFRSREEVLESVNVLFKKIMKRDLGNVEYDDRAALNVGASYPEGEDCKTEIVIVPSEVEDSEDGISLSAREVEGRAIAKRIRELIRTQKVVDKATGEFRPVRFQDIVILTRSIKGFADVFAEILTEEGIPVYAGAREGYFETREIGVLLDYLSILNNRCQDIPLAAVLASYFGGLSDEDLAIIKSEYPKERFYKAVELYEVEGKEQVVKNKLVSCMETMKKFRKKVPYTSIHELLWMILEETGYRDYVSALPGGVQRRANLDMLMEKASAFEGTSYKGLFNFIRYIEQLKKYEVDYGEAGTQVEDANLVRIMSIHKSKGLEFPVVIVAGMGKQFNLQDTKGSILIHEKLGVGLDSIDLNTRTKGSSLIKQVIKREEALESLGEELRVLYVAMTRAKEKLILMGTMKDPDSIEPAEELSFGQLATASTYLHWILPIALTEPRWYKVRYMNFEEIVEDEIIEEEEATWTRAVLENWNSSKTYDEEMAKTLEMQMNYHYPYKGLEGKKVKFSVSELKKQSMEDELSEEALLPSLPIKIEERGQLTGAERGTAYHRVFELLDFTKDYTYETLKKSMDEMFEKGKISEEALKTIRIKDILAFVECSAGKRMKEAAKEGLCYKEQPFVLGVPMEQVYPGCDIDETVLVQGIIDVYFEEDGELVVLDYKTDHVKTMEELRDRYHVQLEYYSEALEQITGKKVKERVIYSVTLNQELSV